MIYETKCHFDMHMDFVYVQFSIHNQAKKSTDRAHNAPHRD